MPVLAYSDLYGPTQGYTYRAIHTGTVRYGYHQRENVRYGYYQRENSGSVCSLKLSAVGRG